VLTNFVFAMQATILQPNPPPKAHEKVITWTEHHPTDAGEMITASADGTCKVWRHPNGTVGA
jgi:mitogen-activated protein kinase organizer 1